MFPTYDQQGKCEWYDGGLEDFVSNYNLIHGTSYIRKRCLDNEQRSGTTTKQPEVLVEGERGEKPAVIEQKSVSIDNFILHDTSESRFCNAVVSAAGPRWSDGCYELFVRSDEFRRVQSREVPSIGAQIGRRLADMKLRLPVYGRTPFYWRFSVSDDDEQQLGIHCWFERSAGFDPEEWHCEKVEAIERFREETQRQLDNAAKKFSEYPLMQRIVVLKFYGDKLGDEDIPDILSTVKKPNDVDEVWAAHKEYVSHEGDYEARYKLCGFK